jgi:hypothetical protein
LQPLHQVQPVERLVLQAVAQLVARVTSVRLEQRAAPEVLELLRTAEVLRVCILQQFQIHTSMRDQ